MGVVESRLAELGLELPTVPAPAGAYVPAVVTGDLLFSAGQIPYVAGVLPTTGKVGAGAGLVPPARAKELAQVCALNLLAVVKAELGDLDRVVRIVKLAGFVAADPSFTAVPGVLNGASELFGRVFGGTHARSAVGVAVLPLDAPVEVELILQFR